PATTPLSHHAALPISRIAARLAGAHTQRPLAEALRLLETRGGALAAQVQRREHAAAILTALAAAGNARASNLLGVLDTQQAVLRSEGHTSELQSRSEL